MRCRLRAIFIIIVLFTFQVNNVLSNEKENSDRIFDELLLMEKTSLSKKLIEAYKEEFSNTISYYKNKQLKNGTSTKALGHLFYKTHRKYLKSYVPYQSFSKLLSNGTYGCLTATALYALLLEELGYDYTIVETNYHIFLVGQVAGRRFLIESTDPVNGFLDSEIEIEKRLKEVAVKASTPNVKDRYRFSFNINRSISLEEIIGLQYYNLATQSYNEGNYIQAIADLDNANKYYQSERINEFLLLVIKDIAQDRNMLIELNLNKHQYQILATL